MDIRDILKKIEITAWACAPAIAVMLVVATSAIATRRPTPAVDMKRNYHTMADSFLVLFDDTFTTSGTVANYVEQYQLTPAPGRQYRLQAFSGNNNGTNRPDTLAVYWNEALVVRTADISEDGEETQLVLAPDSNVMHVVVGGDAGDFVRIRLIEEMRTTYTVWGPETVSRQSAGTQTDTFFFSRTTQAGPYYLFVENPSGGGMTSGRIVVNASTVADSFDIGPTVPRFVKKINALQPNTSIKVTYTGGAGSSMTMWLDATDIHAPVLAVTNPVEGFVTNATSVSVSGSVQDQIAHTVTINNVLTAIGAGGDFSGSVALSVDGPKSVVVKARDANNRQTIVERQVIRDTQAPSLTVSAPADGTYANQPALTVSGTASDANGVAVNANGVPLTISSGSYSGQITLSSGSNVVTVTATDAAGNTTNVVRTVTLDSIKPSLTVSTPANNSTISTDSVVVTGTAADESPFTLTVGGVAVTPSGGGAFSRVVPLTEGPNAIAVVATDAANNVQSQTINVTRQSLTLPPDPSTVAPPLNPTTATSMFAATSFLYTGTNPTQTGVTAGTIQPMTVAVARGRILDRAGNALPGVTIAVAGRPEFGQTLSRADGAYDIAFNGGGVVVLDMSRAGYLPAQRQVKSRWRDYALIDDVRLVQLDTLATTIDFSAPIEVARGSVVSDTSGSRQATLMFEQGTVASMVLPDDTVALDSITVRATEYTVGPNGPESMPAELPANTAYTYAAEFSVDEAIAAGARSVMFSKPVKAYVDNFINLPVGMAVPVGVYNRQRSVWEPEDNGRVIKVLSTSGGTATVDVAGNNQAADSATLAQLSFSTAELQQLASLYASGKTLWRVLHNHFSTPDYNLSPSLQPTDSAPREPADTTPKGPSPEECFSIIYCQTQALGESIAVVGTPFSLVYSSDRVPGRTDDYSLRIPLSTRPLPQRVKRIELSVAVAGRVFKQTHPAQANQVATFTWDGNDAYGRRVQGRQVATIRIDYVYDGSYQVPAAVARAFGIPGGWQPIANVAARRELRQTQQYTASIGVWDATFAKMGGWTINEHHGLDLSGVVMGDGSRRSLSAGHPSVRTVAGTGALNYNGDSIQATLATIWAPHAVATGPDGSLYISDSGHDRVRRVWPDGIITTVAGTGTGGFSGDGGLATQAQIESPNAIKVGRDGSVYFVDNGRRIRRVDPAGIITTIAGSGTIGFAGDGGPATQAQFSFGEGGIALGPDGTIYVGDEGNRRVRAIAPDGSVYTIAGTGTAGYSGDGGAATSAQLNSPRGVALTPAGELIIADAFSASASGRIRKVSTSGEISTIAGSGQACTNPGATPACGDGGLAKNAIVVIPHEVEVAADGSIYVMDGQISRIRRISPDGYIATVVGNGTSATLPDGAAATHTGIFGLSGMALAPDGGLYYAEFQRVIVRKVEQPVPSFSVADIVVPAEDGSAVHVFNTDGRHLRNLHPLTGDTLLSFAYDSVGLLTSITDGDNNTTTIQRNTSGVATAIVGPYGKQTALAMNTAGYLQSITNPDNDTTSFTYHSGGLLATLTTPRGHTQEFTYDSAGRLTRDEDAIGGSKNLTQVLTDSLDVVTVTTEQGRTTRYGVQILPTGDVRRTFKGWDGLTSETLELANDSVRTTSPDGMVSTQVMSSDPRFGLNAPFAKLAKVSTPGGLTLTTSATRNAVLAQAGNPFSLTSSVDTVLVNGQPFTMTWNAAQKQFTSRSPLGRQVTRTIDSQGRIVQSAVPGMTAVTYSYDSQGRLDTLAQGSRTRAFTYNSAGLLATATDNLGLTEQYFYDAANRLTKRVLANGREIQFGYDANGNLASITPPSRPSHTFSSNAVNIDTSYAAPALGQGEVAMRYVYNLDRQITQMVRPDSSVISFGYDGVGRLSTLTIPTATYTYAYNAGTGLVDSLTARGVALSYNYDGSLLTKTTWAGPVSGSVGYVYDNNFRIVREDVNVADSVRFTYDADGLLSGAGAMTVSRDSANGLVSGTSLGNVVTKQTYNALGEVDTFTATESGDTILRFVYSRDAVGRISRIVETRGQTRKLLEFAYDSISQLTTVWTDSVLTASYAYDSNGNRTSVTTSSGSISAASDNQDRLLTHGNLSLAYTRSGDLRQSVSGTDTTRYTHDAAGNLLLAELPGGTEVEYLVDGMNRRIGRKVNGQLHSGWLYSGSRVVAELDSTGQVTSRFLYGSRADVPEFMQKGAETYRLVSDHLGSVMLVVNVSTGVIAQELAYDEFGNVQSNSNPGFQPFGFAGGLYDPVTRLTRFGHRDYNAQIGRWTTKDPIGFDGGDANVYAYVGNNPIMFSDPSGLCRKQEKDSEVPPECPESTPIGTKAGEAALEWYQQIIDDPNAKWYERIGAGIGAAFASLWTPTTAQRTGNTLLAGYGARVTGPSKAFPQKGIPKPIRPIRGNIRLDSPHHNKGWHLDGKWIKEGFPKGDPFMLICITR
jgi:RHS repeat-associated protein